MVQVMDAQSLWPKRARLHDSIAHCKGQPESADGEVAGRCSHHGSWKVAHGSQDAMCSAAEEHSGDCNACARCECKSLADHHSCTHMAHLYTHFRRCMSVATMTLHQCGPSTLRSPRLLPALPAAACGHRAAAAHQQLRCSCGPCAVRRDS
jgi:hypothetical protein